MDGILSLPETAGNVHFPPFLYRLPPTRED